MSGWSNISKEAKDFIKICLTRDPEERPSVAQLFQQPWIKNFYHKELMKSIVRDDDIQQSIQKNLVRFVELNPFQKLVLSLVAGLSASPQELEQMQKEFLRLDKDKTGTLKLEDLKKITESDLGKKY